jgi:glycosyltransferase involved in cell wall biosynthesis
MEPLTLVIPTFNEAETIGGVIREIPVACRPDIIVADVGSTDGTQAVGARVIDVGRGYGRACALGAAAAHPKSTAIAFMDGADRGDLTGEIAQSVLDGTYDLVLASRTRGEREPERCCGTRSLPVGSRDSASGSRIAATFCRLGACGPLLCVTAPLIVSN